MEIQIAKLFHVLVIGGVVLAGCTPDDRSAQNDDAGPQVDAGSVASTDAGTDDADAGTIADAGRPVDAGVDSWLSWA